MEKEQTEADRLREQSQQNEVVVEKELSSIPQTRNMMAVKYMRPSNKYRSKRRNQNPIKAGNILKREKRLKSMGWSLLMFK